MHGIKVKQSAMNNPTVEANESSLAAKLHCENRPVFGRPSKLRWATMDNIIYSRTVSHSDKESSRICLTEEINGYALFEVIRLGDETQEKRLLCWHFKWDRDGAIEHAVEYIHNKQQTWDATTQKYRSPTCPRNLSLWARAERDDGAPLACVCGV